QQKNAADEYGNRAMALITTAQNAHSAPELDEISRQLLRILAEAVHDLDTDKISEESFNSFRAILQIGMEVTRDRRAALQILMAVAHRELGAKPLRACTIFGSRPIYNKVC